MKNEGKVRNPLANTEDNQDLANPDVAPTSVPSFDLFQDEINEDLTIVESGEMESKPKVDETIFDHIRRKSKSFPDLLTLKTMDPSHQPVTLTELNTSIGKTQEDCMILIDSESFENRKIEEDCVILIDKEPANITDDQSDKKRLFDLKSGKISFDSKVNSIDNSTDSPIIVNSELSTDVSKRKLAINWINDAMEKVCKRHRSELSSDSSSTRSYELSCSRNKPEETELCDKLFKVTAADCRNSLTVGANISLDLQDGQQSSCLGTPSGSMEVSFLGFKSVFSFL